MTDAKHTACRIAAQLGRQAPAQAMAIESIAKDAVDLARLGTRTRQALEQRRSPDKAVKDATTIAERYGAMLVDQRDLAGMVMGLRFTAGVYSSGFRNLFFVA